MYEYEIVQDVGAEPLWQLVGLLVLLLHLLLLQLPELVYGVGMGGGHHKDAWPTS